MKGKKCIVTGGAGFIGSHITESLLERNVKKVTVIDNMSTGKIENLKDLDHSRIELICADITESDLESIFEDHDYAFHEAALVSVPESVNHPRRNNRINIDGSFNVFHAACTNNLKKVVCASSAAVYGETKVVPNVETLPLQPLSPYAVSKSTMELYANTFTNTYGLDTACLRYFNVFGPRQSVDSAYSGVIPKFITTLLEGKQPTIHGDGTQTRDFIYVKNIAEANIKVAESDVTGVYNVAHGDTINIKNLLEKICELMGYDFNPKYTSPRPGDIKKSVADISKAENDFGFINEHDFEKELLETIEFYTNEYKKEE